MHRNGGWVALRPSGPRSGPGYIVLGHHHLPRPHPSLSQAHRDFTTWWLIRICLRCAGAPRRPTRGSELSLHIPYWHAVLIDPGEFVHRMCPISRCRYEPSPRSERLGTLEYPAIRFHAGHVFRGLSSSLALRPARLLALKKEVCSVWQHSEYSASASLTRAWVATRSPASKSRFPPALGCALLRLRP